MSDTLRVLFLGDIVGRAGRHAVQHCLPFLKKEFAPDIVIANGENAAGGIGITAEIAAQLLSCGIDVLTTGNHAWKEKGVYPYLDAEPRILRPANYPPGAPGRGWAMYTAGAYQLTVVNLCGRVFMDHVDCPFRAIDAILEEALHATPMALVDFHAEATSEAQAFGWYVDGRCSAVIGTHTHVQTADARILPGGTAYITDAGMCGALDSVIGMQVQQVVQKLRTQLPMKFEAARGRPAVQGVYVEIVADAGRARQIQRFQALPSSGGIALRAEHGLLPE
ncbi:MAG: TIGR00282 family metallophosphoesterase [Armatimonadota bacterium]|nr:TIGR00282 family metallophosphoesterase [bacterium]MDW8319956.1 TIGR00282 family metallophosphoesterase [Armatimonadota bacterium]